MNRIPYLAPFVLLSALVAPATGTAQEPRSARYEVNVELRPVDRATVRIVNVRGNRPWGFRGTEGVERIATLPVAGHGTGVVVHESGLILTAAHVIMGEDALAVILPAHDEALPAEVVYTDVDHDIAFIHAEGAGADRIRVRPLSRRMTIADPLYGAGYPLDVRERLPAAVGGVLARANRDGTIQAAMSVNPGHSGGPVITANGELAGIFSRRELTTEGREGIAYLEPIWFIVPAYERALAALQRNTPTYDEAARVMAQILANHVRTTDERPIFEQTSVPTIQRAASLAPTPETQMIVASHAWNMHLALLEDREVQEIANLEPADRVVAEQLANTARTLAERAYNTAPYLLVRYPGTRAILASRGRSTVPSDEDDAS